MNDSACVRCRLVSTGLAAAIGLVFGLGLLLSGMTDPARVLGFLDVLGPWDPSLALVIGGALLVYAPVQRWIRARRGSPWFDVRFHVPTRDDIDLSLLLGAAIFGFGWGLGGICPGPAIVAAAAGSEAALLFLPAMLIGLFAFRR